MLFDNTDKYPFIEWIKEGKKKQTTRLNGEWSMKMGDVYPVHNAEYGHYQKKRDSLCMIRCTNRYTKLYSEITRSDALNEGFKSLRDFKEYMTDIYGNIECRPRKVMVYEFEVV